MKKIGILLAVLLLAVGLVSGTVVDIDMDVESGNVEINADNTEAHSHFYGSGEFDGNFNAVETGNYLDTNCLVESTTGASLSFDGYQELSGYTSNEVSFYSFASGNTALLNNRFDNSNYVVQLERVDTNRDFLSASGSYGIGWGMAIVDSGASAYTQVDLYGSGSGALDTNQWHVTSTGSYGWGNPDGITAPSLPGYYTPTNTVSATGSGIFTQSAMGTNSLVFNGFNFGAGTATFTGVFTGGMTGTYSMSAS